MLLHQSLPAFQESIRTPVDSSKPSASAAEEERWRETGPLNELPVNFIRQPAVPLPLPETWVEETTRWMVEVLQEANVTERDVRRHDVFLAALIHPSYILARSASRTVSKQLRRVAMPYELLHSGAATLRVLEEVSWLHASHGHPKDDGARKRNRPLNVVADPPPKLSSSIMMRAAVQCGMPRRILFDAATVNTARGPVISFDADERAGEAGRAGKIPEEVVADAFTALCGALSLVIGTESVAQLLDSALSYRQKEK